LETVQDGLSGVFFYEQTVEALEVAVSKAEQMQFDVENVRKRALQFSRSIYKTAMEKFIEEKIEAHNWAMKHPST
jgi:hypothetical protein